jgi:hypothetical protein
MLKKGDSELMIRGDEDIEQFKLRSKKEKITNIWIKEHFNMRMKELLYNELGFVMESQGSDGNNYIHNTGIAYLKISENVRYGD